MLARRAPRRPGGHAPDAGFTLIETLVAIAVIGVVMTALTTLYVSAMSTASRQSGRQIAVQLADDAMERARAVDRDTLAAGAAGEPLTVPALVVPYLADLP